MMKRFAHITIGMIASEEGDWVKYEDVAHLLEEKSIDQHREEFEEAKNIAYRSENGIFDSWEAWKAAKGIVE